MNIYFAFINVTASSFDRGVHAVICFFLLFSMLQFRDGPFIRPHPAFWRVVLGINLLYELSLIFLLFQDLNTARQMMRYIDPTLGVPLPEKSYAEHCEFTFRNIWVSKSSYILAWYLLTSTSIFRTQSTFFAWLIP